MLLAVMDSPLVASLTALRACLGIAQKRRLPRFAADRREGHVAGVALRVPGLVDGSDRTARGVEIPLLAQDHTRPDPGHTQEKDHDAEALFPTRQRVDLRVAIHGILRERSWSGS